MAFLSLFGPLEPIPVGFEGPRALQSVLGSSKSFVNFEEKNLSLDVKLNV